MTIIPTVGRVVWYYPAEGERIKLQAGQPLAALVTCVWSDTCVNLAIFDAEGNPHKRTSVLLVQPDSESPGSGYCTWMPYQIQTAERAQAAEASAAVPVFTPEPESAEAAN